MSFPVRKPQKGTFVYRFGNPKKAGVVLEYFPPQNTTYIFGLVKIKWISGEVEMVDESGLQNFLALVEDHKKKLSTHLSTLEKLQKL